MFANLLPRSRSNARSSPPDLRTVGRLGAALAELPGSWIALRNRRASAADGPPWVKYIALNAERGIALIDLLPAQPEAAIAPLEEFLARTGFPAFSQGDPPIVAVALRADEIPFLTERIDEAFAAMPPCGINNDNWPTAIADLLMSTQGLLLTRIERAREPRNASPSIEQSAPPNRMVAPETEPHADRPISPSELAARSSDVPADPAPEQSPHSARETEPIVVSRERFDQPPPRRAEAVEEHRTKGAEPTAVLGVRSSDHAAAAEAERETQKVEPLVTMRHADDRPPLRDRKSEAPQPRAKATTESITPAARLGESVQGRRATPREAIALSRQQPSPSSPPSRLRPEPATPRIAERDARPEPAAATARAKETPHRAVGPNNAPVGTRPRRPSGPAAASPPKSPPQSAAAPARRPGGEASRYRAPEAARSVKAVVVERAAFAAEREPPYRPPPRRDRPLLLWTMAAALSAAAAIALFYPHLMPKMPSAAVIASSTTTPPTTSAPPTTSVAPAPLATTQTEAAASPSAPKATTPATEPAPLSPLPTHDVPAIADSSAPPPNAVEPPQPTPEPPMHDVEAGEGPSSPVASETGVVAGQKTQRKPGKHLRIARAKPDDSDTANLNNAQSSLLPPPPAEEDDTVTIDGTTYVKGREPHALGTLTPDATMAPSGVGPADAAPMPLAPAN